MRKSVLLFIITSSLVLGLFQNCGIIKDDTRPACCYRPLVPSDPAFDSYVQEFEYYSGISTKNAPIYFADLKDGVAGVCYYFRVLNGPIRWAYIEIDKQYWGIISEYQKINLIFHELGHCVLGRDHTPHEYAPLLCPTSFMHDTVMSTSCVKNNYENYLKEMFPKFFQ